MRLAGNLKIVLQLKDAKTATHFWKLVRNEENQAFLQILYKI